MPLDEAMGQIKGIFYARFMDDWVVLTTSKTALRKAIKKTHKILNDLHFTVHPSKTYIGKISHGFNFLGYYFDDNVILPSRETIRRMSERATALYEETHNPSPRGRPSRRVHKRDISNYDVNEAPPSNSFFKRQRTMFSELASQLGSHSCVLRQYIKKWAGWLKSGLADTLIKFEHSIMMHLPDLYDVWMNASSDVLMFDVVQF